MTIFSPFNGKKAKNAQGTNFINNVPVGQDRLSTDRVILVLDYNLMITK